VKYVSLLLAVNKDTIMIQYYQKFLKSILKLYFDICILFSTITIISIIFAHLFHSLFSTGEYLKLVFIIWVIYIPLFTILYYTIPIFKKSKRISSKVLDNKKHTTFKLILISLIIISLLVVYQSYYVSAYLAPVMGSAKPNLFEGDYLMIDRFCIKNYNPSRGEVVGFKTSKINFDLIKRCVALGGDTLEIKNGIVLINNEPEGNLLFLKNTFDPVEQQELEYFNIIKNNGFEYLVCYRKNGIFRKEHFGPIVVPEHHYFLLGDNRDNSGDSRYYGAFPKNEMFCKAGLVYFSIDPITKEIRWSRIGKTI
jgi:signal peptidase I